MNVTAYWRDEIPAGWKQLDGALLRRIAGLQPATFGDPNRKAAQSEQSMVCSGYGMFVVNNEPRNVPQEILDDPRQDRVPRLSQLPERLPAVRR